LLLREPDSDFLLAELEPDCLLGWDFLCVGLDCRCCRVAALCSARRVDCEREGLERDGVDDDVRGAAVAFLGLLLRRTDPDEAPADGVTVLLRATVVFRLAAVLRVGVLELPLDESEFRSLYLGLNCMSGSDLSLAVAVLVLLLLASCCREAVLLPVWWPRLTIVLASRSRNLIFVVASEAAVLLLESRLDELRLVDVVALPSRAPDDWELDDLELDDRLVAPTLVLEGDAKRLEVELRATCDPLLVR
jgi:hypothetical protein